MKPNISNRAQCAGVRTLGNAQSHITADRRTSPRTLSAHTSLKALADAVLERTIRRTLPPGYTEGAHIADHAELTRLVRLCGEHYGFDEAEHADALAAALAEPVDALACFRTMADQLGIAMLLIDVQRCP